MTLKEQINTAIGAHGLWKGRLREAIQKKSTELSVANVGDDRACAFGKWLHTADAEIRKSPSYRTCVDLHAKFHAATAEVLKLAIAGHADEATKAMGPNSQFFKLSADLTRAMMAWAA